MTQMITTQSKFVIVTMVYGVRKGESVSRCTWGGGWWFEK